MTLTRLRSRLAAVSPGLWVPLGLAVLVAVLFREFLFSGAVFYRRDVHLVWVPQVEAFVRAVLSGSWPLWDPSPGFGQPLLADPSAQILYPFTWLNLLLKPWTYYTLFVATHALFSGWGAALLARRHGLSALACFTAGALWITSGPFISLLDLWHHYAGACWIPWVALAGDRAFASRRGTDVVLFGAAAGLQLLAGSADMVALTAFFLALHLGVLHVAWRRGAWRDNLRPLAAGAAAGGIALTLSAGLWLTAAAASRGTDRWSLPEMVRTYWSVHPLGMLDAAFPALVAALPLSETWRAALYESREPFLPSLYLGLGTWTLALGALALSRGRDRRVLLLLATLLLMLLVALGRHAPFYSLAVAVVPPLRVLRYPVKAMVMASLAASLAAGHGLDWWRRGGVSGRAAAWVGPAFLGLVALANAAGAIAVHLAPAVIARALLAPSPLAPAVLLAAPARRLAMSAALATGFLALLLVRRRGTRAAAATGALAAGLAMADLVQFHWRPSLKAPAALYTYRPEVVDVVKRTPWARVYAYDYSFRDLERPPPEVPTPQTTGSEIEGAVSQQMSLTPATAGRWDIDSSWDVDYRGLYPRGFVQLSLLFRKVEGTPLGRHLLRMGGVTHVVALHQTGMEGLVEAATFPDLLSRPIRVYAVPDTLPRTYAMGQARHATDREAVARLLAADFDPARELIVDDPSARSGPALEVGTTHLAFRRPDRVRIEAEMSAPGYVVLLDRFSDGWRATLDGQPAPLWRANILFRAVAVPAGRHSIEMVYRPAAALAGLGLSVLTALACGLVLARARALTRQPPTP